MPLPSSGNLSLSQVLAEFGAPAGTKLSAMVRGGAYVPDTPVNAGVPTAVPISIRDFLGAANVAFTLSVSPAAPSADNPGPGSQLVQVEADVVVTGTPAGPMTFTWIFLSGDTMTFTPIGTPSGSRGRWQANIFEGGVRTANYRVEGTDGTTTQTADVTITLENSYVS